MNHMLTASGLSAVQPNGKPFFLSVTHQAFKDVLALVQSSNPASLIWAQIDTLLSDPWASFKSWGARYGLQLQQEGSDWLLGTSKLHTDWQPRLLKVRAHGHNPAPLKDYILQVGRSVAPPALMTYQEVGHNLVARPAAVVYVPPAATIGDIVVRPQLSPLPGTVPALVMMYEYIPLEDMLLYQEGRILRMLDVAELPLLEGEVITRGGNNTYQVMLGDPDGWLPAESSDSREEVRAIQLDWERIGEEACVVNTLTKAIV